MLPGVFLSVDAIETPLLFTIRQPDRIIGDGDIKTIEELNEAIDLAYGAMTSSESTKIVAIVESKNESTFRAFTILDDNGLFRIFDATYSSLTLNAISTRAIFSENPYNRADWLFIKDIARTWWEL
mgnify:CR=1 FL=1